MSKKGKKRFENPEDQPLNPKQELFCQLYASDREFFGNGVQSYIEAYEPDTSSKNWYNNARSAASELLTKPNVLKKIRSLLDLGVLNDEFVDKKMAFWIAQDANPMASIAAVKEYNKLKKRIDDKPNVTVQVSLSDLLKQVDAK